MTASREDTVKIDSCDKKTRRFVLRYAISNLTIYDLLNFSSSVFRRVNEYSRTCCGTWFKHQPTLEGCTRPTMKSIQPDEQWKLFSLAYRASRLIQRLHYYWEKGFAVKYWIDSWQTFVPRDQTMAFVKHCWPFPALNSALFRFI